MVVYILSQSAPLFPSVGHWETTKVPMSFYQGKSYVFKVKVNPVVNKTFEKGKKSKRIGVYNPVEVLNWFSKKGDQNGFRIKSASVKDIQKERSYKGANPITHASAEIKGRLDVTDVKAFSAGVPRGIGNASSKAFGFGLLLIKKI